jgi:hypothetical protein
MQMALISELDAGEWSASRLDSFTPRKEPPAPGGWEGPTAGLDSWEMRKKISRHCRVSKYDYSGVHPLA